MAGNKKPRKKYRPRPEGDVKMRTRPEVVRRVFSHFDNVFEQIETKGTIDTIQGYPVYQDDEGNWFDLASSGDGFCEAFRMKQYLYDYDVEPLQRFVNWIKAGVNVTEKEIEPAKAALEKIRQTVMNMTVSEAQGLVKDARVKFELMRGEA